LAVGSEKIAAFRKAGRNITQAARAANGFFVFVRAASAFFSSVCSDAGLVRVGDEANMPRRMVRLRG